MVRCVSASTAISPSQQECLGITRLVGQGGIGAQW